MQSYTSKIIALTRRLGFFSFSNAILQVSNIVKGFFIPLVLTPDIFGVLNKLNLILYYGSYADFGISNGMGRYLPHYLHAHNDTEVRKVADTALSIIVFLSGLIACMIVTSFLLISSTLKREMLIGGLVFSFVLITANIKKFFSLYLRSKDDFRNLGRLNLLDGISGLVLIIILIFPFKIYGIFLATLLSGLICSFFLLFRIGYKYHSALDSYTLKKLFAMGLPMLILGVLAMLGNTLDRLFIIKFFDNAQLGYYALGFTARAAISTIPQSIATFYAPKVFQHGKCEEGVFRYYLEKHTRVFILLNAAIIASLFTTIPLVIKIFLPKYIPSIPLIKVFLLSLIFYGISSFSSNFLILKKNFGLLYTLYAIPIICSFFLYLATVKFGFGIFGISIVFFIYTFLSFTTIILVSLLLIFSDKAKAIKLFLRITSESLFCILFIVLIDFMLGMFGLTYFNRPVLYNFCFFVLFYLFLLLFLRVSFPVFFQFIFSFKARN